MRYRTHPCYQRWGLPLGVRERHVRRVVDGKLWPGIRSNIWDGPPTGRAGVVSQDYLLPDVTGHAKLHRCGRPNLHTSGSEERRRQGVGPEVGGCSGTGSAILRLH